MLSDGPMTRYHCQSRILVTSNIDSILQFCLGLFRENQELNLPITLFYSSVYRLLAVIISFAAGGNLFSR